MSVFLLRRMNADGTIAEIISAHITMISAERAEGFYCQYAQAYIDNLHTDIEEIEVIP